jgi:DNA-binding transcriptional ArsR family regulator
MDEVIIKDLEMLKAVSDPVRIRILSVACRDLTRGWTAKELAAQIGMKQTALYRHLKMLEANGFLKVATTRLVSGITERSYAAVAPSYRFDRDLLAAEQVPLGDKAAAALSMFNAMFQNARAEFAAGMRDKLAADEAGASTSRSASLATGTARLSPASVAKIQQEIARLSEIERYDDPDGDDYGIIIGFYPRGDVRP